MTCASCGSHFPDGALFCPGCGQRITVQRRPAPAPAPFMASPTPAPARAVREQPRERLLPREELDAAVSARTELGERLEAEVIDSFLDRVETSLDARIDQRLASQSRRGRVRQESRANHLTGRIAASLGLGIPLTAIAGGIGDVPGIIAVWLGIVVLNIYYTEVEKQDKN